MTFSQWLIRSRSGCSKRTVLSTPTLDPRGAALAREQTPVHAGEVAAVDVQLLEDVVDVRLDGPDRDAETLRNLLVRRPPGDEPNDLPLARGQLVAPRNVDPLVDTQLGELLYSRDERSSSLGIEDRVPLLRRAYR